MGNSASAPDIGAHPPISNIDASHLRGAVSENAATKIELIWIMLSGLGGDPRYPLPAPAEILRGLTALGYPRPRGVLSLRIALTPEKYFANSSTWRGIAGGSRR